MKCVHCGFEDEGKFCSNCGKPLEKTELPTITENKIKLGFGKSSSANFGYVLELIQQQSTYSLEGDGSVHTALFSEDNIEQFFDIFNYIKNWKTSFVEINGAKVPMSKIRIGLSCFRERQKSYNPENYCFGEDAGEYRLYSTNPLGCRHCGITNNYWSGGWYTIGNLSKSGIFSVDKRQIRHIVKYKIEEIGFCPVLDVNEILQHINNLPDKINPKTDHNFEYLTNWQDGKSIATGVKMKEKTSGFVVEDYSEIDDIDLTEIAITKQKRGRAGSGCGTLIAILGMFAIIIVLFALH